LQHHDPEKWKKKFKVLFDREKIIHFGQASLDLNLKRVKFSPCSSGDDVQLKSMKPLGTEVLATAKFWVLYLTLAGVPQLVNGMKDLASYIENTAENRQILAIFLTPEAQKASPVKEKEAIIKKSDSAVSKHYEEADLQVVGETNLAKTIA
jgi:hypothetical protein